MYGSEGVRMRTTTMRAAELRGQRHVVITTRDDPPAPAADEVKVRIRAVALNHIDVWSWRGMAFAKRELPIVLGAEAAGEVIAVGDEVEDLFVGDVVALYGAKTCGTCPACREGRDNFCTEGGNMYGFHIDGFLRERVNVPARIAVKAPKGLDATAAALAPVTFGTVEHMLFDNARLQAGETVLIHAGGSGIGTAAIHLAKAAGATVITTVGSAEKAEKARTLGADHIINYREERFEGRVRKLTKRRGVDVVFEHVGPETWEGSILSLARGGRLVTCGSTTGVAAQTNLYLLFQQQLRLIGSFGCRMANMKSAMEKMAAKLVTPTIDSVIRLDDLEAGLARLEARNVFGKIVVEL
ncbi:NADPH:quinone oxidoreductase [Hyphomicrobium nitrativorans NL23]|uniref:NADPH:quinone oxidoreductase n=2 Tax=Hyphomicrobium TaxID=81 RepID=V5SCI0_9HYPH|nr:NADPH:quinone oxidoreductase [Hyphomicrobium nitrativorans NL23]